MSTACSWIRLNHVSPDRRNQPEPSYQAAFIAGRQRIPTRSRRLNLYPCVCHVDSISSTRLMYPRYHKIFISELGSSLTSSSSRKYWTRPMIRLETLLPSGTTLQPSSVRRRKRRNGMRMNSLNCSYVCTGCLSFL